MTDDKIDDMNDPAEDFADFDDGFEEEIGALVRQVPQQRLVQPQEIGALIAFLCREEAAGITMEDIQVNAAAWW